jgi:hypothetical protein
MKATSALRASIFIQAALGIHSFYLPGVAPTDYAKGEEMRVKVMLLL